MEDIHQLERGDQQTSSLTFQAEIKEDSLLYLKKCCDYLQSKDETSHLLLVEKLLYLSMEYIAQNNPVPKFIYDDTNIYLEKMNKKSVELFNNNKVEESSRIIARIVDLLTQRKIDLIIPIPEKISEFKILTYNNLSCVYRKIGKNALSLKVLHYAIDLEEQLVAHNYGNSVMSIISTFLNKSAILSQMKKYEKSIEAVYKCLEFLALAEEKDNDQEQKINIKQLYMLAYYNLGVEYDHLIVINKARDNYNTARKLAEELGNQDVVSRIDRSLAAIKNSSMNSDF